MVFVADIMTWEISHLTCHYSGQQASIFRKLYFITRITNYIRMLLLGCFKSFVLFYESTLNCNISVNTYSISSKKAPFESVHFCQRNTSRLIPSAKKLGARDSMKSTKAAFAWSWFMKILPMRKLSKCLKRW